MKTVQLRHLSAVPIINGLGLPGSYDDTSWPRYVRTTDIATPTSLRDDTFASQPPEIAKQAPLLKGDIVMTAAGSIGKTSMYLSDKPACFAGFLARFRPDASTDGRFILHWMQSKHYWDQVFTGAVKSTIENFSASRYRALEVPLIGLDEQRRIADFLDDRVSRIDRIIAARNTQTSALNELEQAILEEDITNRARSWASLRQLGTTVTTGPFGTVFSARDYVEDGVPMINPSHIRPGAIDPDPLHTVSQQTADRLTRHKLRTGDLVVSRKGDIGRSALVTSHQDGWICGSDSIALHPNQTILDSAFLALNLQMRRTREQLAAQSNAATMPSLNETNLLSLVIPAMPHAEQISTATKVLSNLQQDIQTRNALTRSIELLTEYKQSLITAAVTGQLDVTTASTRIPE